LPQPSLERIRACLSPDELARVARFRFEKNRRRYVASQGALRDLLGRYLRCEASSIRFDYGPAGKPSLTGGHPVQFNLSHSDEMALYAIALDREVGVDVELVRPRPMMEQVARRFFAAPEVAALLAQPEAERLQAFYRCWTRKEAYIKAKGLGLRIPLGSFEVSLRPGEPAALVWVRDDPEETARWSMASLDPGNGYIGAVVVQGSGWNLRFWDWQI
jgi:4'-phosphopantetheinyl transferase